MKCPEITKDKFNQALRDLSDNKSTGLNDIPSETLKNLDERTGKNLFKIIKKFYEEAQFRKILYKVKLSP